MYELIEMQLSLMHDVLYTKAAVIHTWYGCFVHAFSSAATVAAFLLFQSSSSSANSKESNLNRADVVVTYTLLVGAVLIEIVSLLGAMGSTWTCALLRARKWHRLHRTVAGVRKLEGYEDADTKRLVLEEIERMVGACGGDEVTLRRYRGQCALKPHESFFGHLTDIDFDDSILEWHFATDLLFLHTTGAQAQQQEEEILVLETTIKALSNYMMFLLHKRPYMLPSPARPVLYSSPLRLSRADLRGNRPRTLIEAVKAGPYGDEILPSFTCGAELAEKLLEQNVSLRVVLGVWVEMLCYAAHHCSRDSHARQLNRGCEFITIAWVLTTASFNRSYCDEHWFEIRMANFFRPRIGRRKPLEFISKSPIFRFLCGM
uniref:Uncharacterized protein n=1 Tax=Avena sativa TaxID=4498 RepID=A0ACD5XAK2_AVESA